MSVNKFFQNKGPFTLSHIATELNSDSLLGESTLKVFDIKDIISATPKDLTFLNNNKYKDDSLKTNALACITKKDLAKFLPNKCIKIIVSDVLLSTTKVSKLFYPTADMDYPDTSLSDASNLQDKYKNVLFGKNVLVGKNVKIGQNTKIGSSSVIESNVEIGENCTIGTNVTIRNTLIENSVYVQDGSKIGIKGFGFVPQKNKNIKTPHIGKVIIKENVEIGSGCTIDRGSLSDTVIGSNTFLDNQVHVAHNVKIGNNCMIAGQVGFAGSSVIGNNVVIGGQAGISGHLNIGNNVSIGGGSGVIKNVPSNSKIMGYPAIPFKNFVKKIKENV